MIESQIVPTLAWNGSSDDGTCDLIDQTRLPAELEILRVGTVEQMHAAIYRLSVRGAPAIGVAAAYGLWLGARGIQRSPATEWIAAVSEVAGYLESARPTAVNLAWATRRLLARARERLPDGIEAARHALFEEARRIHEEDRAICHELGRQGAPLVAEGESLLTHCNAGGLATSEYGTALAVMFEAHREGRRFRVFADETRPLLQGARLTTWELDRAGIDVTLICDNTAGALMAAGEIDKVFVGADRIAANGDACNKIGTYTVAVLAKAHEVPFYVVAPSSTFDLDLERGALIPIEDRPAEEVTEPQGQRIAPPGIRVRSPAFDVTPASLLSGIVTERGVISPVTRETVQAVLGLGEGAVRGEASSADS